MVSLHAVDGHAHTDVRHQWKNKGVKIRLTRAMPRYLLHNFEDPNLSPNLKKVHLLENDADGPRLEDSWRILHRYLLIGFDASLRQVDEAYTCLQNGGHAFD